MGRKGRKLSHFPMQTPKIQQDAPEPRFKPLLFASAVIALVWSAVLLYAGAFTTTIGAGMAFLDWPLSNGSLNPEGWTQDLDEFAEHSHRLAAKVIGLLAIGIVVVFLTYERRRWVRWLAVALLVSVILQGGLGGLRVLYDQLNTGAESNVVAQTFAVMHAMGAQSVVLMLTVLAVVSAPLWFRGKSHWGAFDPKGLYRFGCVLLVGAMVTILIGAIMRHIGAGLALVHFPQASAEGAWFPAEFTFPVAVHFLHRTFGVILGLAICVYGVLYFRAAGGNWVLRSIGLLPIFLTGLQIWFGWLILATLRNPHVTTLHMLNGAFLMAALCASVCLARHRGWVSSVESIPSGDGLADSRQSSRSAEMPAEPVPSKAS